jgi:hypothetical protein
MINVPPYVDQRAAGVGQGKLAMGALLQSSVLTISSIGFVDWILARTGALGQ